MSTQKKIWLLISGAAFVLLAFLALIHWSSRKNTVSHKTILQLGQIIATTYRINSTMNRMQDNANGYYLSGRPYFKMAKQRAGHVLDSLLTSVEELTGDDADQQAKIDTLDLLLKKRVALSDSLIYWYDNQAEVPYPLLFQRAFVLDSTYYRYYNGAFADETSLLKSTIKENYAIIRSTLLRLIIVGFLALGALILIFLRLNAVVRRRKKISDEQIRKGEQQYRQLIENARVVLFTTDLEGRFTFVSGRAESLTGYSTEELVGKSYEMVVAPDFLSEVSNYYLQQIRLSFPESELEFLIRKKDGTLKWVEQSAALLYDEDNNVTGFQCIVKDIDEQKRLQLDMQEMENNKKQYQLLLQAIMDYSPSLIFIKDTESKYLIINKKFEDIFGLAGKDVIGRDDFAFNDVESAERFHRDDRWVMENKQEKKTIQVLDTIRGRHSYMVTKFPLMTASGTVGGVCGIAMDISEQIKRENELEQAWKKAEEAEKAQEHFLAHVSHEIRTPLNGIIGMTNLLKSSPLNAEQQEFAEIISGSSETLLYLINDLLDTAKIKAGKLTLEQIRFNLEEVCKETLSGLRFRAMEKKIELAYKMAADIPRMLKGDPYRLKQILLNLLGNAVKFTDEGKVSLEVSLRSQDLEKAWILFEVEDTGIGIAPDKIDSLFKEFSQVSSDTSRKYGGTGLGLSITDKLVRLQGGDIQVTSEPGKGSRFSISMPYAYETNADQPVALGKSVPEENISLEGISILLVEDNIINQKVAGKILKNAGASIIFAFNGLEAVRYLDQNPLPDIILMDLMMPEMDGYEAMEKIRKELKLALPVIAMTATVLEAENTRCQAAGMDAYISKPFSAEEIIRLIYKLARPGA